MIHGRRAAQVFLNRWLRRGIIAGIGTGFSLPYFALLNQVRVKGARSSTACRAATWCSSPTTRTSRPVDTQGAARIEKAIRTGWLLHFPAGTTRQGAPFRAGVARLLHNTKAVAVPLRVDGFRDLLVQGRLPGKLFQRCSITLHPPMDRADYYAAPYGRESGANRAPRCWRGGKPGSALSSSPARTPSAA